MINSGIFISTNVISDVSAMLIWEICKAYLWGEIISYSSYHNKITSEKSICLAREKSELESKCVDSSDAELFKGLFFFK